MIYTLPCGEDPSALRSLHPEALYFDLAEYIARKTGRSAEELRDASPELFGIVEEEAFRDLVVMAEITGVPRIVRLCAHTLDNPECSRLAAENGV